MCAPIGTKEVFFFMIRTSAVSCFVMLVGLFYKAGPARLKFYIANDVYLACRICLNGLSEMADFSKA